MGQVFVGYDELTGKPIYETTTEPSPVVTEPIIGEPLPGKDAQTTITIPPPSYVPPPVQQVPIVGEPLPGKDAQTFITFPPPPSSGLSGPVIPVPPSPPYYSQPIFQPIVGEPIPTGGTLYVAPPPPAPSIEKLATGEQYIIGEALPGKEAQTIVNVSPIPSMTPSRGELVGGSPVGIPLPTPLPKPTIILIPPKISPSASMFPLGLPSSPTPPPNIIPGITSYTAQPQGGWNRAPEYFIAQYASVTGRTSALKNINTVEGEEATLKAIKAQDKLVLDASKEYERLFGKGSWSKASQKESFYTAPRLLGLPGPSILRRYFFGGPSTTTGEKVDTGLFALGAAGGAAAGVKSLRGFFGSLPSIRPTLGNVVDVPQIPISATGKVVVGGGKYLDIGAGEVSYTKGIASGEGRFPSSLLGRQVVPGTQGYVEVSPGKFVWKGGVPSGGDIVETTKFSPQGLSGLSSMPRGSSIGFAQSSRLSDIRATIPGLGGIPKSEALSPGQAFLGNVGLGGKLSTPGGPKAGWTIIAPSDTLRGRGWGITGPAVKAPPSGGGTVVKPSTATMTTSQVQKLEGAISSPYTSFTYPLVTPLRPSTGTPIVISPLIPTPRVITGPYIPTKPVIPKPIPVTPTTSPIPGPAPRTPGGPFVQPTPFIPKTQPLPTPRTPGTYPAPAPSPFTPVPLPKPLPKTPGSYPLPVPAPTILKIPQPWPGSYPLPVPEPRIFKIPEPPPPPEKAPPPPPERPPVAPPWPKIPGLIFPPGGGGSSIRGFGKLGPVGLWETAGMKVTAPHPYKKGIAGGVIGRRSIRYGAVQTKQPRAKGMRLV